MSDWAFPKNWTDVVRDDFICLFKGEKIGDGISRTVFTMKGDDSRVIKVEHGVERFQNVIEYRTWKELENTPYQKWLAPCFLLSENGSVLIQARTTPLVSHEEIPDQIPAWLSDYKLNNYGFIGEGRKRRFVCHDYGYNLLMNHGAFAKPQMVKVTPKEWAKT